jgi:hypothetical protein
MTAKELYDFAKKYGLEDTEIFIGYACEDDWYAIGGQRLMSDMVDINEERDLSGEKLPDRNIFITLK